MQHTPYTGAADGLLGRMAAAPDDGAALAAFEAGFHAVPAFASFPLVAEAARRYGRCGQADAARLLDGVASQMQRVGGTRPRAATDLPASLPPSALAVLTHPDPVTGLLRRLEHLDREQEPATAVALFEAVFAHLPPMGEYWVHHRMSRLYADAGRDGLAFLLASMALQLEPLNPDALAPARAVTAWLVRHGALAEAGRLLRRREAANPGQELLAPAERDLLLARPEAAVPALDSGLRRDRLLVPASERLPVPIAVHGRGIPRALLPLLESQPRPAISLAELDDAELLIADGAVSVWTADGSPQPELSVGSPAGLVRTVLDRRRAGGEAVDELRLERAALISDMFPAPNLCHFLLDQATRLALYAASGIDLDGTVIVGPDLVRPYQRAIARRLGARRYLGTAGYGRVRVRRLAVLSNCHHLRHSAHLGADWAVAAVRRAFADVRETKPAPRRLLVSRADAATRRLINEDAMLALLRPLGFERIVPGDLSLTDQVRAFAAATHVVAPHGAALANIVFCAPGSQVLEIFHPHYGTYAYAMLAPALRLGYAAMVAWDGESGDAVHNDPGLAAERADASLERHIRVELDELETWLRSCAMS